MNGGMEQHQYGFIQQVSDRAEEDVALLVPSPTLIIRTKLLLLSC